VVIDRRAAPARPQRAARLRAVCGALLCVALWLQPGQVLAAELAEVQVAEPLMQLHTGPGRGFPVFYVAERGETVQIIKRRTDWFKVRTARKVEGWVSRQQIEAAVAAPGVKEGLRDAVLDDYLKKRIEVGFGVGRFAGDPVVSFRTGYLLTENLIAEADVSQVSGAFTGSRLFTGNLQIQPYSRSRFSPYFGLGAGLFQNRNRASLVGSTGTLDTAVLSAEAGMRFYLTRNFLLRLDFKQYLSLTSVQSNDRFSEVQVGLSFFF
jgi:hypothetical protein